MRVYCSIIVRSNNSLVERVPFFSPSLRLVMHLSQTRRSSHLPIYFQTATCSEKRAAILDRNQCLVEAPSTKSTWLSADRNLSGLSGKVQVEIASPPDEWRWCSARFIETPHGGVKRKMRKGGGREIINYYQVNGPGAHDRARINVAREGACSCVRMRACVRRCAHDQMQIDAIAIGKSGEPSVTALMPALILNPASWIQAPTRIWHRHLCFALAKNLWTKRAICMLRCRHTRSLEKLPVTLSRVTHFVSAYLLFTFSPIKSCCSAIL